MRVKDLRRLIDGLADDTVLVVDGSDHSYREALAAIGTALKVGRELSHDHDPGRGLIGDEKRVVILSFM